MQLIIFGQNFTDNILIVGPLGQAISIIPVLDFAFNVNKNVCLFYVQGVKAISGKKFKLIF